MRWTTGEFEGGSLAWLFGFAAIGLIAWAIKFYWFRVVSLGLILVIWGCDAVIAPLHFGTKDLTSGSIAVGIMTVMVGGAIAVPWLIAAKAARDWCLWQENYGGGFWKPLAAP